MNKKVISGILILGSLALIGFILNKNKKENEAKTAIVAQKNNSVAVKIDTIAMQALSADFMANGNFEAAQELNLAAEMPGRVTKVIADEGSVVRVGQVLAYIKADRINVDVQTAQAAYQTALADAQRFENAFKTGGVTKQQLDNVKLNLVNAKSRLQQTKLAYGDATIKATINGIVNKRLVEPGAVVAPGTPLFELVNVSTLKLTVQVPENQIGALKVGNTVKVKASVYPDKEFNGKITFIAPKADASLNFPVEIAIANTQNELRAGMYGTANFTSGAQNTTPVLVAPRNAFVGSVSGGQVFVIENNIAVLKKVTAGRTLGDQVEILAGLNQGDKVVVTGQINLNDGTTVEIIK